MKIYNDISVPVTFYVNVKEVIADSRGEAERIAYILAKGKVEDEYSVGDDIAELNNSLPYDSYDIDESGVEIMDGETKIDTYSLSYDSLETYATQMLLPYRLEKKTFVVDEYADLLIDDFPHAVKVMQAYLDDSDDIHIKVKYIIDEDLENDDLDTDVYVSELASKDIKRILKEIIDNHHNEL